MLGVWLLIVDSALAGCLVPSSVGQLVERLDAAERAYVELDADGFGRALDDVTLKLPCLDEVPDARTAARTHRLLALRLYAAGSEDEALALLRAARIAEPTYRFPDEVLPPDHDLRLAYEALPTDEERGPRPAQPRDGAMFFDGVESPRRPTGRGTLFQLVEGEGVASTRLLQPGEPLPPFAARPRARSRLLAASLGMLAASGALYAAAWTSQEPFWDATQPRTLAELEALQARSRTFTALSATGLGLSAGSAVLAFTVAGSGRPR